MRCYFLRHGIAVDPEAWSGSDFERPLTREGRERLQFEAKAIEDLDLELDRILTSPLLRATQTAAIVADRLDLKSGIVADPRLADGFNLERFGAIVADHAGAKSILLVGHEPTMSATLGGAIGSARIELKKAALAGIEIANPKSSPAATLVCLIPPKILVALGKR